MFQSRGIQYAMAERTRGFACGGLRAIHTRAHRVGLAEAIDDRLKLLERHLSCHESDHVLDIARDGHLRPEAGFPAREATKCRWLPRSA